MLCCLVLFLVLALHIYSRYSLGVCLSKKRMDGKTVIVTGANTGIGFETAKDLAQRRARVILACRDPTKASQARDEIVRATGNSEVVVKLLDLASLRSVRAFARDVVATEPRLDVLVNNAGALGLGKVKSEDGLDVNMQVNHFGPFLLTNLLVDLMKKTGSGRIIFVSSIFHRYPFIDVNDLTCSKKMSSNYGYSLSKLANLLNSNELARRLLGTGITVNSLHPGWVQTDIVRVMPTFVRRVYYGINSLFMKSCAEGAQTTIYLAVSEEVENVTGKYFSDCRVASMSASAQDEALAKRVWDESENLTSN